ncbi:hypothetical protein ACFL3V_03340 [Nanoarchaeota archaeon]
MAEFKWVNEELDDDTSDEVECSTMTEEEASDEEGDLENSDIDGFDY